MGDLFFTILLWGIPILLLIGVGIVDKKIRAYLKARDGSKLTNTLIYILLSLIIVAIVLASSFLVFMILMSLPGATM